MKLKLALCLLTFILAFSACQKCVVCTPYRYNNGTFGVIDTAFEINTTGGQGNGTQRIKLCDKADISAYENGTNFQDEAKDTVRFICK